MPAAVRLSHVSRHFGDVVAVDDVTLDVVEGEFFALLGPSGSGKTTCLRMIAGFERPTTGTIDLHGERANDLPPFARDVNTVFQDYALFPHMSVAANVGYGPAIAGVSRAERARRVTEVLELVRLTGAGARRPAQLSGGQRQRVALARALINRPRLLLLDEPLGALDLKLRQQMQVELKSIQRQLGITFIHVTHDQEEALVMSDRLAVFRAGRIEQIGTPVELYERPDTAFVADFLGTSNVISGAVAEALTGSPRAFAVRPEKIRMIDEGEVSAPDDRALVATGRIDEVIYLGAQTRYVVHLDAGGTIAVVEQNREGPTADGKGRRVRLIWSRAHNRALRE